MSDDLYKLFKEEADEYIRGLNDGLLKLELSEGEDKKALVKEMNRMAHSMKGAARAVGFGLIETVSHYMEEIFYASMNSGLKLTPEMGDSLYDGLDLIQHDMDGDDQDDVVIAEVLSNLEAIVTTFKLPDSNGEADQGFEGQHDPRASIMEDASEIRALSEDSKEMPAISDAEMQGEPAFETQNLEQAPPEDVSEELLQIFYVEVVEHLAGLNDGLLRVETASAADKPELLREMNRVAHSMKGAARAVGFGLVESISHYMEEVLQAALESKITLTPQAVDILYDGLDLIQNALDGNPNEKSVIKAVLVNLDRLIVKPQGSQSVDTSDIAEPSELDTSTLEIPAALMTSNVESGSTPTMLLRPPEETIRVSVEKLDQLMADSSELLMARMQGEARHRLVQGIRRQHMRWLREWRGVRAAYIRLARRVQEQETSGSSELTTLFRFLETNQRYLAQSNRELAQLGQMLAQDNMNMATLADQMQDNVSDLRMMPFETIVSGFQRMVRDMARDLKKQIHLEITGAGVEIDKTVLDALKDPLMHLMRNAIDHGLESPQERKHMGKLPTGLLRLDVEQRGSEIVIRVEDDGHGLDVERIRLKAIERGLLATQEALALTDDDARMLVFHSGFSTSDSVTSLSGRGLGMDIVRNRVEGLRGRVSVMSAPGQGTVVTISVPVSLTRLRVITLRIGEEEYAIPSIMVERMETISADLIYTAEGQEMININDRPTPLVSLATTLNVPTTNERGDDVNIVTLHTVDRSIAFEVDHLYSEFELVLKPLGRELTAAPYVAGAALLGSGEVIIVLDANDLVRSSSGSAFPISDRLLVPTPQTATRKRVRVLVVDDSITTRTLEKNILEAVGFEVFVAMDGAEAWTRIPELEPDLVVSDVEMPQMNGLELARRIKSTERTKHLPVILLTSLGKPEQQEAGLKAGADAYLIKSRFDQGELLDTINSVLY